MLTFKKTFVRKITIGNHAYLVEQHSGHKTIRIYKKTPYQTIYIYNAITDLLQYQDKDLELIQDIFDQAHIERYML